MLKLLDGPAKGSFLVKRAPLFLRAVIDADGGVDVLDQLNDCPKPEEKVYVYKLAGEIGTCHVDGRDKQGKRFGDWYASADYRHLAEVDGEGVRETEAWRRWAIQHTGCPVNPETGEILRELA